MLVYIYAGLLKIYSISAAVVFALLIESSSIISWVHSISGWQSLYARHIPSFLPSAAASWLSSAEGEGALLAYLGCTTELD